MRFAALLSIFAMTPVLTAASKPLRLQPSSKWEVNYADNSCRLNRAFGEGGNTIILSLESEAPGQVDMLAMGKPLATTSETVPGLFLPVRTDPVIGLSVESAYGPAVLWSRVLLFPDAIVQKKEARRDQEGTRPGVRPPPTSLLEQAEEKAQRLKFARQANEVQIIARRGHPVILETGSMEAAINAFDKCSRDSLRDWGIDPDVDDKIVRAPWSPNVAHWFTSDDYPSNMAARGEQSDVKVRLLVDASGAVTKCTSLSRFKERSFNDVVCEKFMKRAHFEPAELADGTKVASYYINHVMFRMPR